MSLSNRLYEFGSFRLDTAKRLPIKQSPAKPAGISSNVLVGNARAVYPPAVLHDCLARALPINP